MTDEEIAIRRQADRIYRIDMEPYNEEQSARVKPIEEDYHAQIREVWADWRVGERAASAKRQAYIAEELQKLEKAKAAHHGLTGD